MDQRIRQLLDDVPVKPPRSKLEPHAEVVWILHQKRRTYREIADFLRVHLQVSASASTLHKLIHRRETRESQKKAHDQTKDSKVPEAVRLLRLELAITQAQFAERLGVAHVTVFEWARGKSSPNESSLQRLIALAKESKRSDLTDIFETALAVAPRVFRKNGVR